MMLASFANRQECDGEFVIARSDAPPLLQFGERAFDAPAVPISDFVVSVLIFCDGAGGMTGLPPCSRITS